MSNKTFSEMDKHYDRHNEGICAVCGCTTARWKLVCDACRRETVQEQERNKNENTTT